MIWAVAQLKTETTKICKKSSKSCSEHDSTLRKIFFASGVAESGIARERVFSKTSNPKNIITLDDRNEYAFFIITHLFEGDGLPAGRDRPDWRAGFLVFAYS